MKGTIRSAAYYWLPVLLGLLMLAVPLMRDLHIESALLASLIGCFWAGRAACSKMSKTGDGHRIWLILQTIYLISLPLFVYALITGCLSLHGIIFWILYPLPSVLFGYSLGRMFRMWELQYRRLITTGILLFIAVGVLIIEFFNLPQVYFFNHVWGGWPGPIYDETVKPGWSLVFFRGLTMAWVGLFWFLPLLKKAVQPKIAVLFCLIGLIVGYSQLAKMGVISPRSYLQEQLGGMEETAHFKLYYDDTRYSDVEIRFIAKKHEFYFRQITETLDISWSQESEKIESYLYGHPWQKKKLVGAKFTSYVPVWLSRDQLHIAKPQVSGSLKHELVHVLSKQFGNSLFNASWSIGLIEGIAVAVAPDVSSVSTVNQIVASEKPYPSPEEMRRALSFWGFYGGRSAVNYTATGSFVQFLLNRYPVAPFKQAYKNGNVAAAYTSSFDSLVNDWHNVLDSVSVDSIDRRIASRLYAFPSLFEQECPHIQSAFAKQWDRYQLHRAQDDTAKALYYLDAALAEAPDNPFVKSRWAYFNLKAGHTNKVEQHAAISDTTAESLMLYADAFALNGKPDSAAMYLRKAESLVQTHDDSTLHYALEMRQDNKQWEYYRALIYEQQPVTDSVFVSLYPRSQARAIQQAIDRQDRETLERYGRLLADTPKKSMYFDTYIQLVEWLAYYGSFEVAEQWFRSFKAMPLRERHEARLVEAEKWLHYLE